MLIFTNTAYAFVADTCTKTELKQCYDKQPEPDVLKSDSDSFTEFCESVVYYCFVTSN